MKKILVVEDEELLGEMYREKFTEEGFGVTVASSATGALETMAQEKPDFVLLDILLHDENGLQFLRQKKEHPEWSGIPVVAFSNYDDLETRKEAIALGALEYLIKTNYTPQEIIDRVKHYLG